MEAKIIEIDKQASDDGDYHAHILSLIEIAKTIKEPTRTLKEVIEGSEWAVENDEGDASVFAELRDTLLSEPKKPMDVPREYLLASLKSYLRNKQGDQDEDSLAKMATYLADIVEDTLGDFE
jgi:hypothetical protein